MSFTNGHTDVGREDSVWRFQSRYHPRMFFLSSFLVCEEATEQNTWHNNISMLYAPLSFSINRVGMMRTIREYTQKR